MKVIFTRHAEVKLRQRRIGRESVALTLNSPDFVRPSYEDRKVAYRKHGDTYLAVIFVKKEMEFIVITTHWIEKIKEKK